MRVENLLGTFSSLFYNFKTLESVFNSNIVHPDVRVNTNEVPINIQSEYMRSFYLVTGTTKRKIILSKH